MRCGEERRAVGKTGIGLLRDIPTRSGEPQDRSPGPLRASAAPRQTLSNLRLDSVGKGLTRYSPPPLDHTARAHLRR